MIKGKKVLGLVTARGGSKRLPKKNVLNLNEKPLIAWSIEAGLGSKYIDDVVVTTEDIEIKEISKEYGAEVPFNRPDNLAKDDTLSIEVILHALDELSNLGKDYDFLFLLQPTSPLRTSKHIDEAISLLIEKEADSIIGVTETEYPIEWTNIVPDDLSMIHFYNALKKKLPNKSDSKRYKINGAIYFCNIDKLIESRSLILKSNCYCYQMDKLSSIDIDEEMDFLLAEQLMIKQS